MSSPASFLNLLVPCAWLALMALPNPVMPPQGNSQILPGPSMTGPSMAEATEPVKPTLPAAVASKLLQRVAKDTQLPVAKLKIASLRSANFDGCLGVYRPNQPCTKILITGWQAIITSPQKTFVYHLSQDGGRIAQNDTASGAGKAINVSFEPFGGTPTPLESKILFQSFVSGSMTGMTTTISLSADGKITELTMGPNIRSRPVVKKTLTAQQVQRFQQLLEQTRFRNFNRLSYLTSAALADYPTTTYQSQAGFAQFIDLEKKNLPADFQRLIRAWDGLVRG